MTSAESSSHHYSIIITHSYPTISLSCTIRSGSSLSSTLSQHALTVSIHLPSPSQYLSRSFHASFISPAIAMCTSRPLVGVLFSHHGRVVMFLSLSFVLLCSVLPCYPRTFSSLFLVASASISAVPSRFVIHTNVHMNANLIITAKRRRDRT